MEIVKRYFRPPKQSFFLFGPRGTGKSTLLSTLFPDAQVLDLLEPDLFLRLQADPSRLRDYALAKGTKRVIVDEVQRVPDLLPVVHQLLESDARQVQFILTGSSTRKLRTVSTDLLGGRVILTTFHPFMASEIPNWNLKRGLQIGQLPIVWGSADVDAVLRTYLAVYMEQEVKNEGVVRNLPAFARFLETMSISQGSLLNCADIARDIQVSRNTVVSYLDILTDLLLCFRLPVFSRRAKRKLVTHEKFYYFDAGVFRSIRPAGPLDQPEEIGGAVLETLVATHLRAFISYRPDGGSLYFWRTKSGNEVDFIVYGTGIFWAIEVKHGRRVRDADLSGLRSFQADYPQAACFLLYRGKERFHRHGVECVPCETFLRNLTPSIV